jgi:hypothetical protein
MGPLFCPAPKEEEGPAHVFFKNNFIKNNNSLKIK